MDDDTDTMNEDAGRSANRPPAGRSGSRTAVLTGVAGGLLAASASIGPAIGAAVGAGPGSSLIALARFRPLFFAIGAGGALAIMALLLARRRSQGSDQEYRALRTAWITGTLAAFAVTYALGRFVIPRLIERL
jgi:hypothetical protein